MKVRVEVTVHRDNARSIRALAAALNERRGATSLNGARLTGAPPTRPILLPAETAGRWPSGTVSWK
jgi:hypothetical protein